MLTTSRYAAMMSGQLTYRLSMWLVSRIAVNSGRSARNLLVKTAGYDLTFCWDLYTYKAIQRHLIESFNEEFEGEQNPVYMVLAIDTFVIQCLAKQILDDAKPFVV